MATEVFEHARALAVFVGRHFVDNARAAIARAGERRIDVRYPHLHEMRHHTVAGRNLIATNVRDDEGGVRPDAQLGAVRITDSDAFFDPNADSSQATAARTSG